MPNWTSNQLIAQGDKAKVTAFLEAIKGENGVIDFNAILPMPPILQKITKGAMVLDGKRIERWIDEDGKQRELTAEEAAEADATGFPDWYDWACAKWGTKWNASEAEITDNYDGYAEIRFTTAWAPPEGIFEELERKFPDLDLSLNYKNEDDPEFPNSL